MKIAYAKGFEKQAKDLPKHIRNKLSDFIIEIKAANSLIEIHGLRQMKTDISDNRLCYRARIGDYRVGFILIDKNTVQMMVVGHRGNVYRNFP